MSTGIFPPPSFVSTQVAGSLGAREPAYLAGSPGPHPSLVEVPARRPPPAARPADPRPPPPPRPTRHSLEQCRNSKRRCAPRNLSTGIGSFSSSAQRGPLLWYSTKERYSPAGGSPEPKEMTSWRGNTQASRQGSSDSSERWLGCLRAPRTAQRLERRPQTPAACSRTDCCHRLRPFNSEAGLPGPPVPRVGLGDTGDMGTGEPADAATFSVGRSQKPLCLQNSLSPGVHAKHGP